MRDDTNLGIVWEVEVVHEQAGDHATDRIVKASDAQIPVIVDLEKFRKEFGDNYLLRAMNGTSLRVMAQRVNRAMSTKPEQERRDAILNVIKGTRNTGPRVSIPTYRVPTPDFTDVVEYRGTSAPEFMAALVDAGYNVDTAKKIIAATMK